MNGHLEGEQPQLVSTGHFEWSLEASADDIGINWQIPFAHLGWQNFAKGPVKTLKVNNF